jgi:hypothetical protein
MRIAEPPKGKETRSIIATHGKPRRQHRGAYCRGGVDRCPGEFSLIDEVFAYAFFDGLHYFDRLVSAAQVLLLPVDPMIAN